MIRRLPPRFVGDGGSEYVRDGAFTVALTILIWLIFIQNMPRSLDGYSVHIDADNFGAANYFDRALKITMLSAGFLLMCLRPRLSAAVLRLDAGLPIFLLLALASVTWSIAPGQTVLRTISLSSEIMACIAFGLASWHPRRFQQVLIPPLMIILGGSLLVGAVAPQLVIEQSDAFELKNAWHGLTHGKNELGMVSGISVIIFVQLALASRRRRALSTIGALISFACLLLSRSNTSLFASLIGCTTMALLMLKRGLTHRLARRAVGGFASVVILYELVIQDLIPGLGFIVSPFTMMVGKDNSFSSRTTIWRIIKEHIQLSPILGTGYGGYWIGPVPESPSYIFLAVMWLYPTESHNGYLEILNDLGAVGLGVLFIFMALHFRNCLELMRYDRAQGALFIGLMFHHMIMNLSESTWFSQSNAFAMLALATICAARGLHDARIREQVTRKAGEPRFPVRTARASTIDARA